MAVAWLMSHLPTYFVCGLIFTLCVYVQACMPGIMNLKTLYIKTIEKAMPAHEFGILQALSLITAVCIVFL